MPGVAGTPAEPMCTACPACLGYQPRLQVPPGLGVFMPPQIDGPLQVLSPGIRSPYKSKLLDKSQASRLQAASQEDVRPPSPPIHPCHPPQHHRWPWQRVSGPRTHLLPQGGGTNKGGQTKKQHPDFFKLCASHVLKIARVHRPTVEGSQPCKLPAPQHRRLGPAPPLLSLIRGLRQAKCFIK